SLVMCRTRQCFYSIVLVPDSNEHVAVNGGTHLPRNSRTHLTTAFLPRAMPGPPMPRYFSNGLLVRTGRTRTPPPSLSKSNLSPGCTPSALRISCGTVIWPLLVMRAAFFMIDSPIPLLTLSCDSLLVKC